MRSNIFACFSALLALLIGLCWMADRKAQAVKLDGLLEAQRTSSYVSWFISQKEALEAGEPDQKVAGMNKMLVLVTKDIYELAPEIDELAKLNRLNDSSLFLANQAIDGAGIDSADQYFNQLSNYMGGKGVFAKYTDNTTDAHMRFRVFVQKAIASHKSIDTVLEDARQLIKSAAGEDPAG